MIAISKSLDKKPSSRRKALRHFLEYHLTNLSIFLMIALFVGVVLYPHVVVTVPSGQVGLLWKRFGGGTVLDPGKLRDEGLHFIFPWDILFLYDLRLQSVVQNYNAISSDGVSLTATVNIRFRMDRDMVPNAHKRIGPDYVRLLVLPEIGSRTREIIAKYTAEGVYSTKRQTIEKEILSAARERMPAPVKLAEAAAQEPMLYDTLVQGIELPPSVVAAINRKLEQYYLVGEYGFRVEREQKESERKVIEANGIADFQKIVSRGISESYLRWRGIEATLELSQSKNAKVVVIGSGRDGLPIILGNVDSAPALRAETGDVGDGLKGATPAKTVVSGSGTDAAVTVAPGSRLSVGKPAGGESGNTGTGTLQDPHPSSTTTTLSDLLVPRIAREAASRMGLVTKQAPENADPTPSRQDMQVLD
jgi:regulator of protease activity HflC (stomatin/prohibitin superfamily)